MTYPQAEFRDAEAVRAAIEALEGAGFRRAAMEMYSSRPVEADPPLLPRRSRMSLGAVLAALLAGGGMTGFMYWTQLDYPLVTGGMPLNSGWATGVVTFESTMAGAVFGTFCMLLWESGLLRRAGAAPAPEVPDEGIVLQVACEAERVAVARETLAAAGGANLIEAEARR